MGSRSPAELPEPSASTKENPPSTGTVQTQRWEPLSSGAKRIHDFVLANPEEKLTALLHHLNPDTLRAAYHGLKPNAAPGSDGITWHGYGRNLEESLQGLSDRIHSGAYRATPVRRVEIPKPDGGTRALGVAAIEDKIVQVAAVRQILNPIYEPEFAGFSYGFRPRRSAHDALDALAYVICERPVNWIVEVDIKGFFDNIDRELLMEFVGMRIGDRRLLRLLRKWLNAGVLDAGLASDPVRGTPQGAPISPLLANVYLHHVLDRWFATQWRPRNREGEACIVRYADDFVLAFQHRRSAVRFLADVKKRFAEFGLELAPSKTRLIEFGRKASDRAVRGGRRPKTFDFLGLTHYCRRTRQGRFGLGRKPAAKRINRTLSGIKRALRWRMHDDPVETGLWLGRVLQGWQGYYAVPTSYRSLDRFRRSLRHLWLRSLRRRSQRHRLSWQQVDAWSTKLWPPTRILHPWPNTRFAVKHLR